MKRTFGIFASKNSNLRYASWCLLRGHIFVSIGFGNDAIVKKKKTDNYDLNGSRKQMQELGWEIEHPICNLTGQNYQSQISNR